MKLAQPFIIVALLFSGPALSQDSVPQPPGKLIDLGGYKLHVNITGKKKPVIVLISGAGDFSFDWSVIQTQLSSRATVVSYDRAGEAWSDLGPVPRTMQQEAAELHMLLAKARLRPPYILVGHSIGGLIARVYANLYPKEVGGMVLLDPTHEDTKLSYQGKLVRVRDGAKGRKVPGFQTMKTSPPLPASRADSEQYILNLQVFGPPKIDTPFVFLPPQVQKLRMWALSNPKLSGATEDYWPEELQQLYRQSKRVKHPLNDLPLVVLIAGRNDKVPEGMDPAQWRELNQEKRQQKLELANLSTKGRAVIVQDSGHHIYLEKPALVVQTITAMLKQVKK